MYKAEKRTIIVLKSILIKNNIFENYISEYDFKIYIKWFADENVMPEDKLHGHIMGKQFLLKKTDDTLEQIREYTMRYAEKVSAKRDR